MEIKGRVNVKEFVFFSSSQEQIEQVMQRTMNQQRGRWKWLAAGEEWKNTKMKERQEIRRDLSRKDAEGSIKGDPLRC